MDICNYICDEEIFNLLEKYDSKQRMYHLQKVLYYSEMLVNLLSSSLEFTSCDKNMLKYSCLLHDLGYFINKEDHHKHSKYIILTDKFFDKLPLNQRNILAVVVGSHRKKLDKEINYYPRKEQKRILELISLLRLADGLDYGNDYVVNEAYIKDDVLHFKLNEYPDQKDSEKLFQKSQLFTDTFNLKIELDKLGG